MEHRMPPAVRDALAGFAFHRETIGRSGSAVYRCIRGEEACYLKIQEICLESLREREALLFLKGKVSVPEILCYEQHAGKDYLLLSAMPGEMACATGRLQIENREATACLLAQGLRQLRAVAIDDCPLIASLDVMLSQARELVEMGQACVSDWQEDTPFTDPKELLVYLESNRPLEEKVFCHGDYCLPNVFLEGAAVSGFIDLGRAGVSDGYRDIGICLRSLGYNFGSPDHRESFLKNWECNRTRKNNTSCKNKYC